MSEKPIVELEPWEYEWASHVGTRRYIENWNNPDAAHYKRERMEDDRTAQVAACVAELAVAKYANRFWSGHVWHRSEHNKHRRAADVGANIEVRRLRTKETAAVRRKQLGYGLVLFVAKPIMPECRQVIIYGFLDYDIAWNLAAPSVYDSENTRELGPEFLRLL
jgi:hypothetical protein